MEYLAQFHPKLVHFPIAFLLVYLLLEIIGAIFKREFFSKTAHLFLLFGVLGALAAVLTGNQAENAFEGWNKTTHAILETHSTYANITLWFFTALLVLRTFLVVRKKFSNLFKYIFCLLGIVGAYFVYQTGDHGGQMVFQHGVGTQFYNQADKIKDSLKEIISNQQDKIDSLTSK
ncbi:MAG: DUF2231 domain-containing protein [Ignavibacteriaceae bacterium]|nr:DUF2231 domain-containing protein [Ignavibacteriaceae bacterium]